MLIAVDFDGTIVQHRYPYIGKEIPFAITTLKKLSQEGHRLVLWTCREGELLDEAVQWCRERGLEFFSVNRDYPEASSVPTDGCRKPKVDMFIDDRNLGGLPDWGAIYEIIHDRLSHYDYYRRVEGHNDERVGFWSKLRSRR